MSPRPFFFSSFRGSQPASPELPALRRTAERFQRLLENSSDLLVEATRQGDILYVSPNVSRVLGYTEAELLHRNIFASAHPEDLAHARALFGLPEGRASLRLRHQNGSWRWIEAVSFEVPGAEGQTHSELVVRDVTDRVEAETARRHLEGDLQQSAQLNALGMLAGQVAHDFNNIFTAVSIHLKLAQTATETEAVKSSLGQVESAVGRAMRLAQQILHLSQRQDGDHQRIRLTPVISEVLQLLRPTWPAGIEIVSDLPRETGWVKANAGQMHQVFTNLFVNGVQAMESGRGRLEVRVGSVVVTEPYTDPYPELNQGEYVYVTVQDTGLGMEAATRQRIFEPFFTTKRQGTGLGLAVVQRIVKGHGAHIMVLSEPGVGTTFLLFFPAQR